MYLNTKYVQTCYLPSICTCHWNWNMSSRIFVCQLKKLVYYFCHNVIESTSIHEAFCVVHFKGEIGHSAVGELNFLPIGKLPNRNINGDFVK